MYQNGIESLHAVKKLIQCFKVGSVLEPVNTIKTLVECEENKEVLTLYDGGYVLSQDLICYKIWYAPIRHSWSPDWREQHIKDFWAACECWTEGWSSIENTNRKRNKCYFWTLYCRKSRKTIIQSDWLLVRWYGNSSWLYPKTGEKRSRYGHLCFHFQDFHCKILISHISFKLSWGYKISVFFTMSIL